MPTNDIRKLHLPTVDPTMVAQLSRTPADDLIDLSSWLDPPAHPSLIPRNLNLQIDHDCAPHSSPQMSMGYAFVFARAQTRTKPLPMAVDGEIPPSPPELGADAQPQPLRLAVLKSTVGNFKAWELIK